MLETDEHPKLNLSEEFRASYEVYDLLGSGAMSVVLRARHRALGRLVAVKFLTRTDEEGRLRFEREARALAGLKHPRIIGCLDAGLEGAQPFVAMELLEGHTLHEVISAGPHQPLQALGYVHQAAQGLAYLHANGVLHRDVKPANLLLTADGAVKVSDFGLARVAQAGATITQRGHAVGTPEYIAPEVVRGMPATAATDVYALGVVLFELLAGFNPFRRADLRAVLLAQAEVPPPDLGLYCPAASAELIALVNRMLAKDQRERPQNGEELVAALERVGAPVSGAVAVPSREDVRAERPARPAPVPVQAAADPVVQGFAHTVAASARQRRMHAVMAVTLAMVALADFGLWLSRNRVEWALGAVRAGAASVVESTGTGFAGLNEMAAAARVAAQARSVRPQVAPRAHAKPTENELILRELANFVSRGPASARAAR